MQDTLQCEDFQNKIQDYIRNVVHADIQELNEKGVESIPKGKEVSYSQPFPLMGSKAQK